jgi:predicted transglutaminase-like cysteine proteinase
MLLLPTMKVTKHILFRFIFLTAFLFCLGLEVYSEYSSPSYKVELSENLNSVDNNFNTDIDAFDDDHMVQSPEKYWMLQKLTCLTISNNKFIIADFTFKNWQPPQKSFFRI